MPKRNIVKQYGENELYHIYNRGVAKSDIFQEHGDYEYLLGLLKRYLSSDSVKDTSGRLVPNYADKVELVAYCFMPNHYHMLVYLKEREGIVEMMRSVMTAYSMYFNKKYKRTGGLFEGNFLASRITDETYWQHIGRYIHLNPIDIPVDYLQYPYSSIGYFLDQKHADWIHPERVWEGTANEYTTFLQEYESVHDLQARLKYQLAHV